MIGASIAGRPVPMFEWQADAEVGYGDRTLTGRVPRDVRWAEQGAPVELWRRAGDRLWSGELVADPRLEGDWYHVRAEGDARRLEDSAAPLLYRADGGEGWVSTDSDPHNYDTAADNKIDVDARPGRVAFIPAPEALAVSDRNGVVFWAEGSVIVRYSYVLKKITNNANLEFLIRQSMGPSGGNTTPADGDATTLLGAGGPASGIRVSVDIDATFDQIIHFLNVNTASTPAGRRRYWATDQRVYGRTTDDGFTASQVVADVYGLAGFDTAGVQNSALAVLPLYWREGHPGLLDYMAELTDGLWMVRAGAAIFRPYGRRVWDASTDTGTIAPLEPEPQYNRFTQPYRGIDERTRYATASATVDPFPGEVITAPMPEPLADPQPNATLALAVAQARVDYEATYRASGPVDIGELRYRGCRHDPYDLEPGDLLRLTDLMPTLGPQRIESVSYRPDDQVSVQVGQAFNMVGRLAELERSTRQRRRRRKAA